MLVCNISQRPLRRAIAADLEEAAAATDAPNLDNAIYASLIDDPAATNDVVDAFVGQIQLEPASATDTVDAASTYSVAIVEETSATMALDGASGIATYGVTVTELANAADFPDYVIPLVSTTWNPADINHVTLSGGNLIALANATFGGARTVVGHQTGKYYWEFTITSWASSFNDVGLFISTIPLSPQTIGSAGAGSFYVAQNGAILLNGGAISGSPVVGSPTTGSVICCAVDLTGNLGWFRLGASGNWNGSGTANPATGVGGINIAAANVSALFPGVLTGIAGDGGTGNFGGSGFIGTPPSGFTAGWG